MNRYEHHSNICTNICFNLLLICYWIENLTNIKQHDIQIKNTDIIHTHRYCDSADIHPVTSAVATDNTFGEKE